MALDNSAYDKIKSVIQAMQAAGNVSMPTLVSDPTDPGSLVPDAAKMAVLVRALFTAPIGALGDWLEKSMREDPDIPMSKATKESVYWGNLGNSDGLSDAAA
jgi:hypothetical protein